MNNTLYTNHANNTFVRFFILHQSTLHTIKYIPIITIKMHLYFVATRALLFTLYRVEFVGCHCCLTEDFILSSSLDRPNAASEVSSLSSLLSLATFLLLRFLFFHLHYKSNSNYNSNLGLLNHEVSEAPHQLAVLPLRLHPRDRRLNPDSG